MKESREQAQTLDCCGHYCLIPCPFFDSVLICRKLPSLGPVCPRSKVVVSQLVPLGKEGRGWSVNRVKECTTKKGPKQKTVKEFPVSALHCEGIWGSSHFIILVYQKICLRLSNLLIVLAKDIMKQMVQSNSHISSVLREFKVEIAE